MTIFIDIFKAKKSRWVDISYRVTAAPLVGALPGTALAQGVHRGGARAGGVVPAGSEVVLVQPVLPLQLLAAVLVGLVVHPGHHLGEHRHALQVVVAPHVAQRVSCFKAILYLHGFQTCTHLQCFQILRWMQGCSNPFYIFLDSQHCISTCSNHQS